MDAIRTPDWAKRLGGPSQPASPIQTVPENRASDETENPMRKIAPPPSGGTVQAYSLQLSSNVQASEYTRRTAAPSRTATYMRSRAGEPAASFSRAWLRMVWVSYSVGEASDK